MAAALIADAARASEYKQFEKQRWNELAEEWLKWVDETEQADDQSAKLNSTLFKCTQLRAGMHMIDLCCGEGELALQAAATVGPLGRIIGVDVSEPLIRAAQTQALRRGVDQVAQFVCGDAEELQCPPNSVDNVYCRFGIFYLPNLAQLVSQIFQSLRPGGYFALTVWGQHVETFDLIGEIVHNLHNTNASISPDCDGAPEHRGADCTRKVGQALVDAGFLLHFDSVKLVHHFQDADHYLRRNTPWSSGGASALHPSQPEWRIAVDAVRAAKGDGELVFVNDVDVIIAQKPLAV